MNNGLKALLIAASTIITCMIVTLGFSLAREARQIGNQVTDELEHYKTTISEREIMKYDGTAVYGADIVNLIKTELKHKNAGMSVRIIRGEMQQSISSAEEYETDLSGGGVNLSSKYLGKVIRNKNDVITEIQFIEIREE